MLQRYEINTGRGGRALSLEEIREQMNKLPQKKTILLAFSYSGLSLINVKELLQYIPPNILGIDLGSLVRTVPYIHTRTLDEIEEICALLPRQFQVILAERILHSPSDEQINQFLMALPKAKHLSLKSNYLNCLNSASLSKLQGVEILELDENWLEGGTWPPTYFDFFEFLPVTVTTIRIRLPQADPYRLYERRKIREDFFRKLPPHIHTLGLNAYDFKEEVTPFNVPSSVHTLQWFWHPGYKPEVLKLLSSSSIQTLDLSNTNLGDWSWWEVAALIENASQSIRRLMLDNNQLHRWSIENLISFLKRIPNTVTTVSLKGNRLFQNRALREQDNLLKELQLFSPRLAIEDNGSDDLFRAAPPLLGAIQQHLISEDAGNLIASYLGAKTLTFREGVRKWKQFYIN
ncbi:MAG: hypothetical protein BGO90_03390 [Legionella sp. 40-6]|nr:MAG: hypothetical protein BGO90_03390 [Legionella sp. 40-6]